MTEREVWAVIPSYCRHGRLQSLVHDLLQQDVRPIVIDNGYEPPARTFLPDRRVRIIREPIADGKWPNLSALWNTGLAYAAVMMRHSTNPWALLVLNDDVSMSPGSVELLTDPLFHQAAPAATFPVPSPPTFGPLFDAGPVSLDQRMTGWCFAIAGRVIDEDGFTFDQRFRWWYGDDDADWTLRRLGGVMPVHAPEIRHLDPDGWRQTSRGDLLDEQAKLDRQRFDMKWEMLPW